MGLAAALWIPIALAALLLLPIRIAAARLPRVAFWIWLLVGIALTLRGALRFRAAGVAVASTLLVALAAVLAGFLKGRLVLSRAAARNLARLRSMSGARRPAAVYSPASWILIAFFMSLGLALGWLHAPMIWRGAVSLAVGVALLVSSFDYLRG